MPVLHGMQRNGVTFDLAGTTCAIGSDSGVGRLPELTDPFGKASSEDFYTAVSDSTYIFDTSTNHGSFAKETERVQVFLLVGGGI
jgi:hypothetical protein